MAEFLSQDEIDALLDITEEDVERDFGSPEFEKLTESFYNAFHPKIVETIEDEMDVFFEELSCDIKTDKVNEGGYIPKIQGNTPKDMMDSLQYEEEHFQKTIKNYEIFKKYHKKFKEIAEEQPEIFI